MLECGDGRLLSNFAACFSAGAVQNEPDQSLRSAFLETVLKFLFLLAWYIEANYGTLEDFGNFSYESRETN